MNSIGQDALVFSSDNQAPNGMLVKKGSSLTIVKTTVSNRAVDFIAMDSTTKARLYLNNFAKFKVTPSHSQEQVMEVTLAPSGTCLRYGNHVAQLVEHRTGIAEVTGSNPVEALIFFRLLLSNCLNWKINCDDHSSLSSTIAVHI